MARFRVLTRTFIAPNLYNEGDIIDYAGPPGMHLQPLDSAAMAAHQAWAEANPHALISPVDGLPMTVDGRPGSYVPSFQAQASMVAPGQTSIGHNPPAYGQSFPGPTDGGPQVITPEFMQALAAVGIKPNGGFGAIATPDSPGTGSDAPSAPHTLYEKPPLADNLSKPLPGDPSKPGEGAGVKEAIEGMAKANAVGAEATLTDEQKAQMAAEGQAQRAKAADDAAEAEVKAGADAAAKAKADAAAKASADDAAKSALKK